MNYELAKRLKEAGFPQKAGDVWYFLKEKSSINQKGVPFHRQSHWKFFHHRNPTTLNNEWYSCPTLSELIESCVSNMVARNTWQNVGHLHFFEFAPNINTSGEISKIGKIYEWRTTWTTGSDLDNIDWVKNFFGSTPEEAVAMLWLELNK